MPLSSFAQYRAVISIAIIVSALVGFLAGAVAPPYLGLAQPLASPPTMVQNPTTGETTKVISEEQQVINLVERAKPAVVSIIITKELPKYERFYYNPFGDDPFFRQFFGDRFPGFQVPSQRQNGTERRQVGAGSGFIVSADGYIVTNRHVVADEAADYTTVLNDGRKFPAKVLARDPVKDIAIIKIEAGGDLPFLTFGKKEDIKVGQTVVVIGNALGEFSNTVSKGVISGVSRSLIAGDSFGRTEQLTGVIQTDAAVNPGNSGGPLLNLKGEVVGMSTAVAQGAENIGFALPADEIVKDLEQVKAGQKIVYPFLGVRFTMIDEEIQEANNLPVDYGALVVRGENRTDLAVVPGGPADKAGIGENDIILEINGIKLNEQHPLNEVINRFKPGDKVNLKVLSKGQERTVSVELGERK